MNRLNRTTQTYSIKQWNKEFLQSDWPTYFTQAELNFYGQKRSSGSLVARYLVKKYLFEQGFANSYHAIEILNSESGQPTLSIDGMDEKHLAKIHFSLSHSKTEVAIIIVIDDHGKY